jgi:hypothetical protein
VPRLLPLILALVLVAIVAVVWIPPVVAGPSVDCGALSEAECAEAVSLVVADANRQFPPGVLMPVTRVEWDSLECLSYQVTWLYVWGVSVFSDFCGS